MVKISIQSILGIPGIPGIPGTPLKVVETKLCCGRPILLREWFQILYYI